MHSKAIRVVVALVLATAGTGVLVRYVENARVDAAGAQETVSVLVVEKQIDKGTKATEIGPNVRTAEVPAPARAADAVTDIAELGAKHASVDLLPGEQVVLTRFTSTGIAMGGNNADGLLQVTIPLTAERALGGNVKPGDTVGVLLSIDPTGQENGPEATHISAHKRPVTNVQLAESERNPDEGNGTIPTAIKGKYLVTIAVTAAEAEQIVFVAENGSIWLTNEPEHASTDGTGVRNPGNVFGTSAP